ncbi:ATP synthase subunit s, mitochondrial, partial [Frankliniella fusca]
QNVVMKGAGSASTTVFRQQNQQRFFWQWVCAVFNKVSKERIEEVGPDRACAEWLLRNGASVQWVGKSEFVTDYNALPLRGAEKGRYLIKAVNATDSSIMAIGFPHFKGCNNIDKIVMKNCNYLDDSALPQLSVLRSSLKTLEIMKCLNLTSEGVLSLAALSNLSRLKLEELPQVQSKAEVKGKLMSALPNCNITFDEAENDAGLKT